MECLKKLKDEEILQIKGIGQGRAAVIRKMRDDALAGILKLNKKSYPYPKNKTRAELKAEKELKKIADEVNSKPIRSMNDIAEEAYAQYGITTETQKSKRKARKP